MQTLAPVSDPKEFEKKFKSRNTKRSDQLIEWFLIAYFITGLGLALYYDTWLIALIVGGACLAAYFISKKLFPSSTIHHYVASAVVGVYMGQFIYQMHGLFEMHFFAFVGSALMITYQNWKTQIPVALVVVVHHAIFGYLQYQDYVANAASSIYFTQLDYMSLETFIIHGLLASLIFFICGLWAYQMHKRTEEIIENSKSMMVVTQANDSVAKNLEYAILLSEGALTEKIEYSEDDLMGEALSKIQKRLS